MQSRAGQGTWKAKSEAALLVQAPLVEYTWKAKSEAALLVPSRREQAGLLPTLLSKCILPNLNKQGCVFYQI
ncbi:MAG: hypothetical protein ACPGWR_08745 [Ardenticatenaceae bacterium]